MMVLEPESLAEANAVLMDSYGQLGMIQNAS